MLLKRENNNIFVTDVTFNGMWICIMFIWLDYCTFSREKDICWGLVATERKCTKYLCERAD